MGVIVKELREHLPFTLVASLVAGILVAVVYNFWTIPSESFFEVLHPAHVLVSAAATSAMFRKYKKSVVAGILVGVVGAILIGSLSDVLLPWVAGNLFSFEMSFHLPIFEEPFLILGVGLVGALAGLSFGLFNANHSLHVLLSIFASLFYFLAFSSVFSAWVILAFSLIVFVVVLVPCCLSDIVFPLLFVRKAKPLASRG